MVSNGLFLFNVADCAYRSMKALTCTQKQEDAKALTQLLELWIAMAVLLLYESSLEIFIAWFPFYYLLKCILLALFLIPDVKVVHVIFTSVVEPAVFKLQELSAHTVLPLLEDCLLRYGWWVHAKLMNPQVERLHDHELLTLQKQLQEKLDSVEREIDNRKMAITHERTTP